MASWEENGLAYSLQTARCRHGSRIRSPLVLVFSFMVILTSYFALLSPTVAGSYPASPQLQPCPLPGHYVPNCIQFDATVVTNSTNSTVLFELTDIGASVTLVWGPTTSYQFPGISDVSEQANIWYPVFLNFLKPSTTYYYKLTGTDHGETTATWKSSWTTASDSGTVLSGTVYDSNGNVDSQGGLYVVASCAAPPNGGYTDQDEYTVTGSNGHYSITPLPDYYLLGVTKPCGSGGYSVALENSLVSYYCVNHLVCTSNQWIGVWNETLTVYAPASYNFYLPLNTNNLGPYTPIVLDFTNDNYVSFDYESSFYTTTTSSWQFDGQGESTSATSGNLVGLSTTNNPGSNLEYYVKYDRTGTVNFNAMSGRTAAVSSWSYVGGPLEGDNSGTQTSDWVTPFYENPLVNETCYTVTGGGAKTTHTTTYEQSFALDSNFNLDIQVSLNLGDGASVQTSALSYSNSISNGDEQAWTLTYLLYAPSGDPTNYIWNWVQPGTSNQVGPIDHAWSGPACP